MKLIIDIDSETYTKARIGLLGSLGDIIANGTPLPDNHGDLIDRDKLEKDTEWSEYEDGFISYSHSQIFSEPVVIPAERGE